MIFVDSHTHLDQYPREEIPAILERAQNVCVEFVVCAGTDLASSRDCVQLANCHPSIYAGLGIHPTEVSDSVDERTYCSIRDMALGNSKVVCISETGLDFLPTSPEKNLQIQVFREQIRLAIELGLPIIFHSRESHAEALKTLMEEQAGDVGGVMHYYQGDQVTAQKAIDLGFYISIARPLLRLPELQQVAEGLPLEHLVLESDAFPQPFKKYRHNWTEPRHVREVAQKLADLKGVTLEEVAQVTTANITKLLKLDSCSASS